MEPAIHVFLGDRHNQPEIVFDQILLGSLSLSFSVADYGHAMPEVAQRGAGSRLALPNLAPDLANPGLGIRRCPLFQLAELEVQNRQLFDGPLDLLAELPPAAVKPRNAADRARNFHFVA